MSSGFRNFELTVGLLALVLLLVQLSKRVPLPYPAVMALAGLIIALIPGIPTVEIDPDFVLVLFLPPILYSAAWNTSWPEFKRNLRPIAFLAIGLVFATMSAVAIAVHAAVLEMPWAVAFLLGAIVSPPDAIAATAIFERLGVPRRLVSILEGESLVNDAGALVAFRTALAVVLTGMFSWEHTALRLLIAGGGGIAVGTGRVVPFEAHLEEWRPECRWHGQKDTLRKHRITHLALIDSAKLLRNSQKVIGASGADFGVADLGKFI